MLSATLTATLDVFMYLFISAGDPDRLFAGYSLNVSVKKRCPREHKSFLCEAETAREYQQRYSQGYR